MEASAQTYRKPTDGILKRFLILVPLVAALALGSFVYIQSKQGTYEVQSFNVYTDEEFQAREVTLSNPDVLEVVSVARNEYGGVRFLVRALADGETTATFGTGRQDDGRWYETWQFSVHDGFIVEGGINFAGWKAIYVSVVVLMAALAALFASMFVRLWRASWYGYTMIAGVSGLLFSAFQLVLYTILLVRGGRGGYPDFYFFLTGLTEMAEWFTALALYPLLPLAFLVSISNIALIRHEGRRPVNMLGIAASVACAALYLLMITAPIMLSPLTRALYGLVPLAMAFGECLLFSTMLCAWLASKHVPKHGVDYLVVLGCGIRPDGTPCPLLASRVDRAVEFDLARQAAGDAPATFVPSGGQGPDEPTSEAQSMGSYLQERWDIPAKRIALEDRSTTTRENMAFSRDVIQEHAGRDVSELRVGFSTTNYHVFRGYVCAHQAGMNAEGMGSKTKYYFWPNAFLREFVGLLANRWKSVLISFALLAAVYLLSEYVVYWLAHL